MMRRPGAVARVLAAFVCASGAGCGRGDLAAPLAAPPSLDDAGMTRCTLVPSQLRPFIVDWSATDRGALELQLARGVVAARYEGCALTLLPNCRVDGEYVYSGVTRKHESLTIRSADELYARLPLGAVELEPSLERAGQLHIDMTLVGMLEARRAGWSRADMEGQCTGVTHVISGAHVGAFTFYSGTTTNVAPLEASITEHELLNTDGSPDACEAAAPAGDAAPAGCRAILRIELTSLQPGLPRHVPPPDAAVHPVTVDASDLPPPRGDHPFATPEGARAAEARRAGRTSAAVGGAFIGLGVGGLAMLVTGAAQVRRIDDQAATFPENSADYRALQHRREAPLALALGGAATAILGGLVGALGLTMRRAHLHRAQELDGLARVRVAPAIGRNFTGLGLSWTF